VAAWNREHGFTGPVIAQYWHYADGLLHGNLCYSFTRNQSAAALFEQRWARSLYLSATSLLLAFLIAIPLGIYQAVRRNSISDHVVTGVALALYGVPDFLFYVVAIQLLAFTFPVFDYQASQSSSLLAVMGDWRAMTLPIACFALIITAGLCRYMRSAAVEILVQDYIKVARAKGLPERLVLLRHLVRNASLPMVTLIGLSLPILLAGNLVTEYLFNYPGLGLLFFSSLQKVDYPVLLAYTLAGAILVVVGNLIADIALTVADPRIRLA
jgi:peptide/nickel transport system permease protein